MCWGEKAERLEENSKATFFPALPGDVAPRFSPRSASHTHSDEELYLTDLKEATGSFHCAELSRFVGITSCVGSFSKVLLFL